MIWRQDSEPRPRRDRWRGRFAFSADAWPTCEELRAATAHEDADTVTQILSGDGITRGLGAASARRMRGDFTVAGVVWFGRAWSPKHPMRLRHAPWWSDEA